LTAEYRAIWDAHLADAVLLLCPCSKTPYRHAPMCYDLSHMAWSFTRKDRAPSDLRYFKQSQN
jgi:hypothetical protein